MPYAVTPFETRFLEQLNLLPPPEWQSDAYDLFMHNEWQPWFHPYQVLEGKKLVGFGMLFHFEGVAWLGWILVHKKYRKQGIGKTITLYLMDEGKRLGANTQLLTATELGYPIYEKLGFKTTAWYHFFNVPAHYKPNFDKTKIRAAMADDLDSIINLDRQATDENRIALLKNHLGETYVFEDRNLEGFFIETLGDGFIVASSMEAGIQLIHFRIRKKKYKLVVPGGNKSLMEILSDQGFYETHKIPHMVLGNEPNWKPEMIFNRASGYCG